MPKKTPIKKTPAKQTTPPTYPGDTLFVTFYSYKGGVGRSLALANCAVALAAAKRKVLVLDFDLEAPGLDSIFSMDTSHPGLVDYLTELKKYITNEEDPGNEIPEELDLKKYIQKYVIPAKSKLKGHVDYFGAGSRLDGDVDNSYMSRVEALAIRELYAKGQGLALFKVFKEMLRKQQYDYVLIDARTGLSDIGIVCTYDLADAFVFLCGFNQQNIDCTKTMIDALLKNTSRELQDLPHVLVVSPVPEADEELKSKRLKEFKKAFGHEPDIILPYHSQLFYIEDIFLLSPPPSTLKDKYNGLTNHIREFSGDTFDRFISEFGKALSKDDFENLIPLLERAAEYDKMRTLFFLNMVMKLVMGSITLDLAERLFDFGLRISDKKDPGLFFHMGNYFHGHSETAGSKQDIERFLQKALKNYERSLELNKNPICLRDYGDALSCLARLKSDPDLFQKAIEELELAIQLKPDDPACLYSYGDALWGLAKLKSSPDIFQKAFEKYEHALRLKPDDPGCLNNYGGSVAELAELKSDPDMFQKAIEQFEHALRLKPDNPEFLYNYSRALVNLAKLKSDPDLFQKAFDHFKQALRLKPGDAVYLFDMACAKALSGNKKEALEWLAKAVIQDAGYKEEARKDEDFANLRKDPKFLKITAP